MQNFYKKTKINNTNKTENLRNSARFSVKFDNNFLEKGLYFCGMLNLFFNYEKSITITLGFEVKLGGMFYVMHD